MDLMIVMDVVPMRSAMTMLTGPLCLKDIVRRSEVANAFGDAVFVETSSGKYIRVPVKDVSISQALSGAYQVSVAVELPEECDGVALERPVRSEI